MSSDPIVISGISGRFPGCENTDQLYEALIEGRDLVSDNHGRWATDFFGMTNRAGVMKDIESFDYEFFGVPPRQADGLDPRTRLLLETTFEAILDAGINPIDMRGSRTGVYLGMATSKGKDSFFENKVNYTRIGRSMAMASGMISFTFDLKGPTYALDTACSGSLLAFCQAFRAIKGGECDAAIVCGASILLDPNISLEHKTMNILSPTGKCQFLDEERDGFVESESIAVTLLQKSKDAKRVYATVKGCGTNNDGYKVEGITKPSAKMQGQLLEDIYREFGINPLDVTYMEAHGTGTTVGDLEETMGISNFLCKGRIEPLLIGSVKTNVGHTGIASGLTSIIKVILTMEHGVIPPILHLKKVGKDIAPVHEGKLKPVTELTPWNGGLIGINSFGVGGTNAHVVLEANIEQKSSSIPIENIRLVHVAGRTEEGLEKMMEFVKSNQHNRELIHFLDNIFYNPFTMYNYRGYIILDRKIVEECEKRHKKERKVWFVYSGIGSQWVGMARDLMKLDYFKNAMDQCADVLRPYNIDLIHVVSEEDEEIFKNVTNCFVSIIAISICLTDFLKHLGIEPDGLIGHSLGEICCAYADGFITKREALLIARARGIALQATSSIEGYLAVVGLTIEEAEVLLPEDIEIACYNCVDNITVSGPKKSIIDFVSDMNSRGKFSRLIQGTGIAFHSKYIAKAGDILQDLLRDIIKDRKPLSKRWISTSVQELSEHDRDINDIIHCPEYYRNNLVNSVHFFSAMTKVPQDAIVIEISPKGLLQTVIHRNLGKNARIVSLSSESAENNCRYLLSAIGKLYLAGLKPDLRKLYNGKNIFPVSRGTPSLASLVDWEHSSKFKVSYYSDEKSSDGRVEVDLMDPAMKYLEGHVLEGEIVLPVMGYVYLAWEIFARLNKKLVSEVPVVLENIKIRRMTPLPKGHNVIFNVNILHSSGDFEITQGDTIVCFGTIKLLTEKEKAFSVPFNDHIRNNEYPLLNQKDVYNKLRRNGFEYRDHFQGILEWQGSSGKLKWNDHWIAFLDSAIHYTTVTRGPETSYLPESIGKIIIDPENHLTLVSELNGEIPLEYDEVANIIRCGKLEIRDLQLIDLPAIKSLVKPKLQKYQFIPYNFQRKISLHTSLNLIMQVLLENTKDLAMLKILELCDFQEKHDEVNYATFFSETLKTVINEEMVMKVMHDKVKIMEDSVKFDNYDLVIINRDTNNGIIKESSNTFFLLRACKDLNENAIKEIRYTVICKFFTENGDVLMLIRRQQPIPDNPKIIRVTSNLFECMNELKMIMHNLNMDKQEHIYLLSENEGTNGIMGLFNCLRHEDKGTLLKMIFLADRNTEKFSFSSNYYRTQLAKGLNVNVLRESTWGSYRFLPYERTKTKLTEKAHAEVLAQGDFSQIKMIENSPFLKLKDIVHIYYAGMNFKDVVIANGVSRIPGTDQNNFEIGYEFSGRTTGGKRVMGISRYHAFGTEIEPFYPTLDVPDDWTLEEAASVPLIYFTLYFAFHYRTSLEPGKSILIHSASGGVGMAAIEMALRKNCLIFATVGSEAEKEVLLKDFPKLDKKNIFSSREDSFEVEIKKKTNGRGVDIILNSLASDLFNSSLKCVATNGDFVEIGRTEFLLNSRIHSELFLKSASLHAVSLDDILLVKDGEMMRKLSKLLEADLKKGLIKPIPHRKVFDIENITEAFKYFQTNTHTGKVLLKIRNEEPNTKELPTPKKVEAISKLYFSPKRTYIIIGGLGGLGLGLELAILLSSRGAKHIFMNSRSEPNSGYQLMLIRNIQTWGTKIHLFHMDISDIAHAEKLLKDAIKISPVGGIFNVAMVTTMDAIVKNQSVENFAEVFKLKGLITKTFDILSRKLCPELDHFVAFSSATCGRDNLGQTNNSFANSTVESSIERRNDDKLPGLVIQWGPLADDGSFAKTSKKEELGSYIAQPIASYFDVLNEFLLNSTGILSSTLQRDVVQSIQDRNSLLESVMKLFGITSLDKLNYDATLLELGMDSLMGFEIKQLLYKEHEIDLTIKDLRNKTIKELQEIDEKRNNEMM